MKTTLTEIRPSRRAFMASAVALALLPASTAFAGGPSIHVAKDPNCGCCNAWIDILQAAGFTVTTEDLGPEALAQFKAASGLPANMLSCHTGKVEGYAIEGHVPVADILRLLQERPDAIGLAVPGMPYGSPGMGPEDEREAYDVFLVLKDGTTEVFASYAAA